MDQEKIGKFIKLRREKLGLTQKELADKIFISDKTVSKWEKGRGLMDITMIKPLSEILEVTIPELINGNYIEKEENNDEILDETFNFIDKKHKKDLIKTIILLILIPVFIFIISLFIYKVYLINRYTIKENKELSLYLKSEEARYLDTKKHVPFINNEIIEYGNFYITNKFSDYTYKEPSKHPMGYGYNPHKYIKYNKNNKVESAVMFIDRSFSREIESLLDYYSKEALIEHKNKDTYYLTKAEIYSYFGKNNINNDVDLVKYCRSNYYFKNSVFSSISSIKENRTLNKFCYRKDNFAVRFNITYLTGDYDGFILDIPPYNINPDLYGLEDKNEFTNMPRRDLYISNNNRYYIFTFIGSDVTTDKYIQEFISGLWII